MQYVQNDDWGWKIRIEKSVDSANLEFVKRITHCAIFEQILLGLSSSNSFFPFPFCRWWEEWDEMLPTQGTSFGHHWAKLSYWKVCLLSSQTKGHESLYYSSASSHRTLTLVTNSWKKILRFYFCICHRVVFNEILLYVK